MRGAQARGAVPAPRVSNSYVLRQARTPKGCFVCHRPATFVLASTSMPTIDFFYTCASHTRDATFCTPLAGGGPPGFEGGQEDGARTEPAARQDTAPAAAPRTETEAATRDPQLHRQFALHREFFAQRLRYVRGIDTQRRASTLKLPGVPGADVS